MIRLIYSTLLALVLFLSPMPICAQSASSDWKPTGNWPFVNRHFRVATVYTGVFKRSKTQVPCNIHVGNMALWYSQNDTLLEAIPGTVLRVEFADGDVYIPVGSENLFGRVVREDTINGRVARVVCVMSVDQKALDKRGVDALNISRNNLQMQNVMIPGMESFMSSVADANGGIIQEEEPLPMEVQYYFQVNGEFFPTTTKNILAHINPARKKEYKVYTRMAEIISENESSMLKIWNDFFLNDKPVLDKNMEWIKRR